MTAPSDLLKKEHLKWRHSLPGDIKDKEDKRHSTTIAATELAILGEEAYKTIEKNLSKNKPLAFFIMFSIFALGFFIHETIAKIKYGFSPTEFSKEATLRLLYAAICFIVVAIFGFIILACKISNLMLGILYMFLVVLVINFGMLSVSRGISSLLKDNFHGAIEHLLFERFDQHISNPESQSFYDNVQQIHKCCGWGTDITESWPLTYNESNDKFDLVDSCCIKKLPNCGREAGRGLVTKPISGHTIVIHNKDAELFLASGTISLKHNMGFHDISESIRALLRPDLEPTDVKIGTDSSGEREILLHRPDHSQLRKIDYEQTEIGVHIGIVHIWDITSKDLERQVPNSTHLYFSKGLIETVLFLDKIFRARCEQIERKGTEFVKRLDLAYNDYTFFLGFVWIRMEYAVGFSSCIIMMIIILAIFFWGYYSKLKAEQMANLAAPTDFDLLNLQLPTYAQVDELKARRRRNVANIKQEAKDIEKEIAHITVAEKLALAYEELELEKEGDPEGLLQGDQRRRTLHTQNIEMWTNPKLLIRNPALLARMRRRDNLIIKNRDIRNIRKKNKVAPAGADLGLGGPLKPKRLKKKIKRQLDALGNPLKKTKGKKKKGKRKLGPGQAELTDATDTTLESAVAVPVKPGKKGKRKVAVKVQPAKVQPAKVQPVKVPEVKVQAGKVKGKKKIDIRKNAKVISGTTQRGKAAANPTGAALLAKQKAAKAAAAAEDLEGEDPDVDDTEDEG